MAARLSEPDNNWSVLALERGAPTSTQQMEIESDLSGVHDPNYFSVPQRLSARTSRTKSQILWYWWDSNDQRFACCRTFSFLT